MAHHPCHDRGPAGPGPAAGRVARGVRRTVTLTRLRELRIRLRELRTRLRELRTRLRRLRTRLRELRIRLRELRTRLRRLRTRRQGPRRLHGRVRRSST
ncbi:hypothetical protein FFT09_21635 [Saccharomonospora piscinae]|nr:hypothetical protein FFT09_21635 [Saccharomonospora piscinae]